MRVVIVLALALLSVSVEAEIPSAAALIEAAVARPFLDPGEGLSSWSGTYNRLFQLDAAADDSWRTVDSIAAFDAKRRALREKMIALVGGFPSRRTPLNARTVFSADHGSWRTEGIVFESRPGVFVTGVMYLPADPAFNPPYRAAIELCGHSLDGKNHPTYSRIAMLAALNGIATFVVDPICQGERAQCTEDLDGKTTVAHLRLGVNALLLGRSMTAIELWDAIRALDYLDARSDLRHDGYGAMGNSGGGTQSVMLSAVDERVRATATSCYLANLREQTAWRLLPDSEQMIFAQLKHGLNHAAYPLLGGNPVMMLARREDMIPFTGTLATFRLLTALAARLDRSGWYAMCDVPGPHEYCESTMRASVSFLAARLCGWAADFADIAQKAGTGPEKVSVTPTGRVMDLPGFKSAYAYLGEELDAALVSRRKMSAGERAALVRRLADIDERRVGARTVLSEETVGGTKVVRATFETEDGYRIPTVELTPGVVKGPPLLLVGDGARSERLAAARGPLSAGRPVLFADIAATGEIGKSKHHYHNPNDDEEVAKMLNLMGSSLVGRRAGEIVALAADLGARYAGLADVVAHGRTAVAAAHARAAAPEVFGTVTVVAAPPSWGESVRNRLFFDYASAVNGGLLHYDWRDLLDGGEETK